MGARVAVAGASGYAGGELLRLLAAHPDLEIAAVTAGASAGQPVAALHPHLAGVPAIGELTLQPQSTAALSDCDLAFLALPAGESATVAAELPESIKVVDLGPDFRLADGEAWQRHYRSPHAGQWVTGLPELPGARAAIRAASRVAAPGCYATAAIIALVPLVAAGLVDPSDVVVVAASGTSGAGRSPRADLLASEIMGSVAAYSVAGTHRHTPEIEQALLGACAPAGTGSAAAAPGGAAPASAASADVVPAGRAEAGTAVRVSFTPLLVPMPRGILATCTARLVKRDTTSDALREAIAAAYQGEPFITLLADGSWPATSSVAGSNGVHLQAAADPRAGRAVAVAAIDNLGKGAAGQAIQAANLMLGLPETAGLTPIGVAP
jgi:N-acetyl-gamma-glutamyl-phosphate reductase